MLRFQAGESDIISRVGARNFAALEKDRERRGYELVNAGSSLEYSFLFFNLADLPAGVAPQIAAHQAFLRRKSFRQAVSAAIDRDAIVRLVYLGHAVPLAGPVPPGNKALDQHRAAARPCVRWNGRGSCWPPTASNGTARARLRTPRDARSNSPS